MAEAFQTTATTSGTAAGICVFLDPTNTATTLVAGIYANEGGKPGALLAQGTPAAALVNGAFNPVLLPALPLVAGTTFWIALLAPLGTPGELVVRDHCCGFQSEKPHAASHTSKQVDLTQLPPKWKTGTAFPKDGPLLGWAGSTAN